MRSLLSVIPVIAGRLRANARLLAAVVVGAVVAAALLSTTKIYADALRDLGLSYALRNESEDDKNIRIRSASQESRADLYQRSRDFIAGATQASLGELLVGQTWFGRSATFFPTPPGQPVSENDDRLRSNFEFFSGLEEHVTVVDGRLPVVANARSTPPLIEVAISSAVAERAGVSVGDRFDAHPFFALDVAPVSVTVVGLLEQVDPEEPYWLGLRDVFDYRSAGWQTLLFFVPEETYFGSLVNYLPTMTSDFWSLNYLDTERISAPDAEATRLRIEALGSQLNSSVPRTVMQTSLPEILRSFDEKLFFTRLPVLVVILQVAGIVLYYLFMVSTMLVERQAAEIALLKSRGATTLQVMQMYFLEGLVIAVIAVAAGPPLAGLVIGLLGQTPAFSDLTAGENLHVTLSTTAYLWAAGGAALALLATLWPAYQATRRTVVQYKTASARPPVQAAFTRYYLDLVLVAIGGILFYQLDRRGSIVTDDLFGDQTADPVQLLTPTLFILTVAIFFLRLFPVVLRGLAWVVSRFQGTALLIGMWQLVRNPVHYSRLVLLLILATAVGMFSASFGATLNQSYEDRAAYAAGAPYRLAQLRYVDAAGPTDLAASIGEMTGATAVSPAFRVSGSAGGSFDSARFTVLGIEPESFASVAFFREDFADQSLAVIAADLASDEEPPGGIVLPADAHWLGVWVRATELRGRVTFVANLRDATGRYLTLPFANDSPAELPTDWVFLAADLTAVGVDPVARFSEAPPQPPLTLQSLSVRLVSSFSFRAGVVQFDDLQTSALPAAPAELGPELLLVDPERSFAGLGDRQIVADFESVDGWESLRGLFANAPRDALRAVPSGSGGGLAAELVWDVQTGRTRTHGMLVKQEARPLAVYASDDFIDQTGIAVGNTTTLFINNSYVEAEIIGSFSLFPTLVDVGGEPALITDVDRLLAAVNGNPSIPAVYATEAWLIPGPETSDRVAAAIEAGRLNAQTYDLEELRAAQERDPLLSAGWEGILFISFAAILLLSALGFLIYSYLTAQRRNLEFAILRTLGFSRRQIAVVVGFEQVFVIALGMVVGSLVGLRLGTLMIDFMGLSETGDAVVPPMILHVSWITMATAWAALGAAFLVTIGIVVLLYSRLALHRVLRIGET